MIKSLHKKILMLLLGSVLITVVLAGGAGILNASRGVEEDSRQIMSLTCETKTQEIDTWLLDIEHSVDTIYCFADSQLTRNQELWSDEAYMNAYTAKIYDVMENAAQSTNCALSVYLRFNPELLTSTSGIFLVKQNDGTFRDEPMTDLAYTDNLTGLHNHHYMKQYCSRYADQEQVDMGVVFCDLNGLKYSNDHFGHAAGDELICSFVDLLKESFPDEECCRMSGDEFVVIVPSKTEEEFFQMVEELVIGKRDAYYVENLLVMFGITIAAVAVLSLHYYLQNIPLPVVIVLQYLLLLGMIFLFIWVESHFGQMSRNAYRDMFRSFTVPYVIAAAGYYIQFFVKIKTVNQMLMDLNRNREDEGGKTHEREEK